MSSVNYVQENGKVRNDDLRGIAKFAMKAGCN